jgi:hypothetical protein
MDALPPRELPARNILQEMETRLTLPDISSVESLPSPNWPISNKRLSPPSPEAPPRPGKRMRIEESEIGPAARDRAVIRPRVEHIGTREELVVEEVPDGSCNLKEEFVDNTAEVIVPPDIRVESNCNEEEMRDVPQDFLFSLATEEEVRGVSYYPRDQSIPEPITMDDFRDIPKGNPMESLSDQPMESVLKDVSQELHTHSISDLLTDNERNNVSLLSVAVDAPQDTQAFAVTASSLQIDKDVNDIEMVAAEPSEEDTVEEIGTVGYGSVENQSVDVAFENQLDSMAEFVPPRTPSPKPILPIHRLDIHPVSPSHSPPSETDSVIDNFSDSEDRDSAFDVYDPYQDTINVPLLQLH